MARPCGEFKAKWEKRPDRPGMLTVHGECELAAVYRIVLTEHQPPSEDSREKVLDLIITLPSGLPPTAVENRSVLYFSFKEETEEPYERVRVIDVNSSDNPKQEWVVPVRVLTQSLADVAPDGTKWSKMERPNRV